MIENGKCLIVRLSFDDFILPQITAAITIQKPRLINTDAINIFE